MNIQDFKFKCFAKVKKEKNIFIFKCLYGFEILGQ